MRIKVIIENRSKAHWGVMTYFLPFTRYFIVLNLLLFTIAASFSAMSDDASLRSPKVKNLLFEACFFYSDVQPKFASMLPLSEAAKCNITPERTREMTWAVLDVSSEPQQPNSDHLLIITRSWLERVVVQFHYQDGSWIEHDIGPYEFDNYWSVGNDIEVKSPANDAPIETILIGLQDISSVRLLREIRFMPEESWIWTKFSNHTLMIFIIGILLSMIFYNLSLAITFHFNFQILYCFFVLTYLSYTIINYGLIAAYLPNWLSLKLQMNLSIFFLGINGTCAMLFVPAFLEKRVLTDRWRKMMYFLAFTYALSTLHYIFTRGWDTDRAEFIFVILSSILLIVVCITIALAIVRKSRAAYFYLIAWLMPVIGLVLRLLRSFELIETSTFVEYSISIGIALETIILSIGIVDRIGIIRKERDTALAKREQAETANAAKSDFLARISHELRTPLHAILGLSNMLQKEKSKKEQQKNILNIQRSGDALLQIINDILDFSKIEASKMKIEMVSFETSEILDTVNAIIQPAAYNKGLAYVVTGKDTMPLKLIGDPNRIKQILINLTTNAVKFTDNGTVSITIECPQTSKNTFDLIFHVQDSGIGMNENQTTHLFHAFTQADETISRKYGGSGLGLAICKQLTDLMNGELWVESKLGEGSIFHAKIPVFLCPEKETISGTISAETFAEKSIKNYSDLKGKNILIVEDNPVNQMLAVKILKLAGISTDVANDGQQAITKASNNSYDLILMDIQMPVMDGLEATRQLRQLPKTKDIPIIAATANTMMDEIETAHKAGMNHYIAKPYSPATLIKAISDVLGKKLKV